MTLSLFSCWFSYILHTCFLSSGAVIREYRSRMPLMGREISFIRDGQEKNARVTGVDEEGGLMVETAQGPLTLRCGEVSLGSHSFLGLE